MTGRRRSILGVAVLALATLWLAPPARACAACFGRSDSPLAEGMNMGILCLLGVIVAVLVAFASFFVFLARRAALLAAAANAGVPGAKAS